MLAPLLTYVTDTDTVSFEVLLARIGGLSALPPELRKRTALQLREPGLPTIDLLALGDALRTATKALGIRLIVNDRLDLAEALDADGVHLGRASVGVAEARQFLGEKIFVSVACHSVADVLDAAAARASAVTLSPIFETPSKGAPLGVAVLRQAREALKERQMDLPLIALGGITDDNFQSCIREGATGVATIRAEISLDLLVHAPV